MSLRTNINLGFDTVTLRQKYRSERDRRLRSDGNIQYQEIKDDLAHYLKDPYAVPIARAPLIDEVDALIVGGGFGGLLVAAKLRHAGLQRIMIVEKGGDLGGAWYWNRYPGISCDVESYIYLPLLEEVGTMPAEKYSRGAEILAHCQAIGEKFDLYQDALFQTEVTEMRWVDAFSRWLVKTNHNDSIKARFVCLACGPLHRPKLPGIPGIGNFKGASFHTSRWDYHYTQGNSNGNLTGLKDKRVAIIGTGATAVQCIPHLGASAKQLYVFQRTPSSIDTRANQPTDSNWANNLKPGWQQKRMDNFNALLMGLYQSEDLVGDGWTEIIRNLLFAEGAKKFEDLGPLSADQLLELADFDKMERIRARVDAIVKDPVTAEALKPYYRQFCKRPCFHDEYLETFNRPNVSLIDTRGSGVERITENSIFAKGIEYPIDCIIYATGFEVGTPYTRRSGFEIYGKDGQSLTNKWAQGIRTFHGFHVEGFPNCFIISNAQSGFTVNFPHMLAEQARHLTYIIDHCMKAKIDVVEATPQAEAEWVETIRDLANLRNQFLEDCTPSYYNNEGRLKDRHAQDSSYGAGPIAFAKVLDDWRIEGSLKGLHQTGF